MSKLRVLVAVADVGAVGADDVVLPLVGEELVQLVDVKGLKNDGVDVEEKGEVDDVGVEEEGVDVLNLCSLWAPKSSNLATLALARKASILVEEVVGEELGQLVGVKGLVVGVEYSLSGLKAPGPT